MLKDMKIVASFPRKFTSGFTIVELAVVIIVIGILVAVTTVSWGSWQERTAKSEIKNDLTGVSSSMESQRNWNNGYPVLPQNTVFGTNQETRDLFTPSRNVTLTYRSGDASSYCIDATSQTRPSVLMHIEVSGDKRIPEDGGC